jgi:hypothetical protein
MNGLSGTALAKTTSLAQPMADRSAVRSAVSLITSPIRRTASMLMPAAVVATLTEAQTRFVAARASGSAAISSSSIRDACFSTSAENPPMKSTPTACALSSSAWASSSRRPRSGRSATHAIGVTATRRFTMGTPVSTARAFATGTRSAAAVVTRRTTSSGVRHPRRLIPSVTVRMSRWPWPTIPTDSRISSMPSGPRAIVAPSCSPGDRRQMRCIASNTE